MNLTCPSEWIDACLIVCKGKKDEAEKMAETLWRRHGVPGVKISVQNGVVIVSHPGGIVGLESGWERI